MLLGILARVLSQKVKAQDMILPSHPTVKETRSSRPGCSQSHIRQRCVRFGYLQFLPQGAALHIVE